MTEKLDLNVLLPAGMTRRQTMKAPAAALGASVGAAALRAARCPQAGRTLNYFTWSSWDEKPFADPAKAKVNIDLRPTFFCIRATVSPPDTRYKARSLLRSAQ